MFEFMLALFAAFCWGIAPLFGKVGLKGVGPLDGLAVRTIITVCFIAGWIFASNGFGRIARIPLYSWAFLGIEAFLATFAGDLGYYAAIKYGEIGQTALVLAASPLFTLWAGWYCFGESVSPVNLIGAALLVAGVILIGWDASS